MKVSIIVATYNRRESLKFFLESLKDLALPDPIKCEVLIIDNNSIDCTKTIVEGYLSVKNPKVRYIFEGKQGKSNALNTGVQQAAGDIIVFTDDDCIPDPTWIASIHNEFENHPSVSALGGKVELYNKKDYDISTVYLNNSAQVTSLRQLFQPLIIGCNMAIRKSVIYDVGFFDPLLGPGSSDNAIVEDIDVMYKIIKKGYKVVYSPYVIVFHNHGRKKEDEINDLLKGYSQGRGAFCWKHIQQIEVFKMFCKDLYSTCKTVLKGFITREDFPYHKMLLSSLFFGGLHYQQARHKGSRSK